LAKFIIFVAKIKQPFKSIPITMDNRLIECVPNFSEGRNMQIIKEITDAIESVKGIRLLDVDAGEATNRTVVTFVGTPDDVCEAAYRGVKRAAELIDMSQHHGGTSTHGCNRCVAVDTGGKYHT